MAAPTLSSSVHDAYDETGNLTATISWSADDLIIVLAAGANEAQTLSTPTGTGLIFLPIVSTTVLNNTSGYAWYARPAASGSGVTITAVKSGTNPMGMSVFVYSGSDGIGRWAMLTGSAASTINLVRGQDNAAVVIIVDDFDASADVTVTSAPAGASTQHVATNIAGQHTVFVISWTDQGSAGSSSYGYSAGPATDNTMIVIEIRGTSGTKPPDRFLTQKR